MQGACENQGVACKVSAAVAYHLLNACSADKQTEAAAWLAKLDLPLLQSTLPQPGTTIKVLFLTNNVYYLASQVLCNELQTVHALVCQAVEPRLVIMRFYVKVFMARIACSL